MALHHLYFPGDACWVSYDEVSIFKFLYWPDDSDSKGEATETGSDSLKWLDDGIMLTAKICEILYAYLTKILCFALYLTWQTLDN